MKRLHIILSERHQTALADLAEQYGLTWSDVVRLLILQAHKSGSIKGVTK